MYDVDFHGKFQNSTLSIFNKTLFQCWYKISWNHFLPVMIDTTHNNVNFLIKLMVRFPGVV